SLQQLEILRSEKDTIVIDQPNSGLAAARNAGARAARGEFLAFLDADDRVAPDYYAKAVNALRKNNNVFFVGCWARYFENSTQLWPSFTPQAPYALVHNMINSSALVYKKNAFLVGGQNDAKAGYGMEDYESVVNMLASGFNGIVLPEPLFYYRVRTGSMFRKITTEKLLYAHHYIASKHAAYYTKFAIPVMQLLQANGPGYCYDNPTFATKITVSSGPQGKFNQQLKQFVKRNEWLKKIALQILKIKNKR
ncbi:MAG TPA: glycosyltransferase, partial [Chitinophagaceae bacterium]|nr:glycosyltransferase [Chitinophagaceae bacterium]